MGQQLDMNVPGYESLAAVLSAAFDQAARGKGKERHANDTPFDQQPMQLIADRRGIGFILGQADKKSEEAQGMLDRGEVDAAIREILGAIVYLAGSIVHIQRKNECAVIVPVEPTPVHDDGFAPIEKERTDQGFLLADGTYSGQYKVGDKFKIVRNDGCCLHSVGDVVEFTQNDGTLNPWFDHMTPVSWWKLVHVAQEKPTTENFTLPENWKDLITVERDEYLHPNGFSLADGSHSHQYKVGDKFWVVLNENVEPIDEPYLVTFIHDDGSSCPEFLHDDDGHYRYWWKLIPAT